MMTVQSLAIEIRDSSLYARATDDEKKFIDRVVNDYQSLLTKENSAVEHLSDMYRRLQCDMVQIKHDVKRLMFVTGINARSQV
jgi:hypothetical protein